MDRDPDDKLDFSALDPSRNPARWESMIQATLARSRPLATVHPLFASLASTGRVALALAAALAAVAWLPSLLKTESAQTTSVKSDPATQLATWASLGEVPADESLYTTFGGDHVGE